MMEFEEFTSIVAKGVEELAEGKIHVKMDEIIKNDGLKHTGATAVSEGANVFPVIHMESFYNDYKCGICSVAEVVEAIHKLMETHLLKEPVKFDVRDFLCWDKVKSHIFIKLINGDRNAELLKQSPHRMVMDLAEVFYVKVERLDKTGGAGTIMITSRHCEVWKTDVSALHEAAIANMTANQSLFIPMNDVLKGKVNEPVPDFCRMYVLTNRSKFYGASEILKKNMLDDIAGQLQDNLIILPSSVHDVIIIPEDDLSYDGLADIVKEVNTTSLALDEVLSNHVYKFDRETKELSIAA